MPSGGNGMGMEMGMGQRNKDGSAGRENGGNSSGKCGEFVVNLVYSPCNNTM